MSHPADATLAASSLASSSNGDQPAAPATSPPAQLPHPPPAGGKRVRSRSPSSDEDVESQLKVSRFEEPGDALRSLSCSRSSSTYDSSSSKSPETSRPAKTKLPASLPPRPSGPMSPKEKRPAGNSLSSPVKSMTRQPSPPTKLLARRPEASKPGESSTSIEQRHPIPDRPRNLTDRRPSIPEQPHDDIHRRASIADQPPSSPVRRPSASKEPPAPKLHTLDFAGKDVRYWEMFSPSAKLQQPEQIASFSYDENRRLYHDDRAKKFFKLPPAAANLNHGYDQYVQRDESKNEHLDSLLFALMKTGEKGSAADMVRRRADIITWRGMATKLCAALYEGRDGFQMNLQMVNDTLYIEEWVSREAKAEKAAREGNARQRKMAYHGYAFESWCTSDQRQTDVVDGWATSRSNAAQWGGNVNTNVQWCSIVKTKLGDHRLILGGEVDCVDPETKETVELKTTMVIRAQLEEARFETKMLRFYLQSFLLGIPKVFVGFRDREGTLQATHEFETLAMPAAVKGKGPHEWSSKPCLNMANAILQFAQSSIRGTLALSLETGNRSAGEQNAVFRLAFDPVARRVTLIRLTDEEVAEVKGPDVDRVGFLPRRYYDFANKTEHVR